MKKVLLTKRLQTSLMMFAAIFTFMLSSCVDTDMYELYDEDLDSDIIIRNKKSKDDSYYGNGNNINPNRIVFNNTCFMAASCHASKKNDDLWSYINNLDDFIRNKRNGQDLGVCDTNRARIVHSIFGTSPSDARNGASDGELRTLLSDLTGYSYEFQPCSSKEQIKSFISQHQSTNTKPRLILPDKKFKDKQYLISIGMGATLGHVFNYDSYADDIGETITSLWGSFNVTGPSGNYLGVYYPTGEP